MASALELVDEAIAELQARLNIDPSKPQQQRKEGNSKKEKKKNQAATKNNTNGAAAKSDDDQSDICKLEFKVGVITKAWYHETADKLYCEEIDVGEAEPRQIASGLRPFYSLEQMQGQRLLVVANLKAKNLLGFKSHGMVLCAAQPLDNGEGEKVEFIEPPAEAPLGEVVAFEGLPTPRPVTASQVEKKKIFQACMEGMKTNDKCVATWNGHVFMTSAGPCKAKTIAGGALR